MYARGVEEKKKKTRRVFSTSYKRKQIWKLRRCFVGSETSGGEWLASLCHLIFLKKYMSCLIFSINYIVNTLNLQDVLFIFRIIKVSIAKKKNCN